MKITHIDVWKFSIPMEPFTIATGTMDYAQNTFIRIHTDAGIHGVGECSAFPMIVGETQNTCFEMAKDFARLWKSKNAENIEERMQELHLFTAGNATIKSAFDMALYDLNAKKVNLPLYKYLGGTSLKQLETDLTMGINTPEKMAATAKDFVARGVKKIKVKLGKNAQEDVIRMQQIRAAAGDEIKLRIDANQGWSFEDARFALTAMGDLNIQYCEQPMRTWNDGKLPELKNLSPIKIMADESIYHHHDAERLIATDSCHYLNIKFAKSSGILESIKIAEVARKANMPCMIGGMLESRLALSAFAQFAQAYDIVQFYDLDTCMVGHLADPVTGGIRYNDFYVEVPEGAGLGSDVKDDFLSQLEHIQI
ncbi:mandelate racemase/muconate lactonizing enzyme family protein [Gynurincola endophyticus]|uniref:mandelate racemase/muconate lactonizing enzyme family protein n=1 Tax=Gynurincola endophyticus TaxID=2479004 RepID=UPI000F8D4569|nr:dipeptide epimerase [Gynurincola endophyticus]